MSVPNDTCSECCVCPTPTIYLSTREASLVTEVYNRTYSGSFTTTSGAYTQTNVYSGGLNYSFDSVAGTYSADSDTGVTHYTNNAGADCDVAGVPTPLFISGAYRIAFVESCAGATTNINGGTVTTEDCSIIFKWSTSDRQLIITYALPDHAANFAAYLAGRTFGAFANTGALTATLAVRQDLHYPDGSYPDCPTMGRDESYAAETRYKIAFPVPKVGSGKCYRLAWVERVIPEAGVGLTSLEVVSPGVGRPTVTIAAPPSGGTQAYAVAVMNSAGHVASILLLNPGSGYVTAPAVTVQAAINGGTTSTGWTATVTDGQISAIAGGSAGDYLWTLALSGGAGIGATATATMDAQGGIATATLSAIGSGYSAAPALTITPKVSGSTAPLIHLHLGTETTRCSEWDGITPGGYVPATPATWPTLPVASPFYFEVSTPAAAGTTTLANLRAYCDCSDCPA